MQLSLYDFKPVLEPVLEIARTHYIKFGGFRPVSISFPLPPGISIEYLYAPKRTYAMARYQEFRFAALRLTAEDKKEFDGWFSKTDMRFEDLIEQFGAAGFKVSIIFVDEKNAWCFSVIGTLDTKKHDHMVMTSWSDMITEAAAIAFYKHFILLQGEAWPTEDTRNNWG